MNFSFGVQQQIGHGAVFDVAYLGTLGRHLQQHENINATPFGANFQPGQPGPDICSE